LEVFDNLEINFFWELTDVNATSLDDTHNTDTFDGIKYVFLGIFESVGLNKITFRLMGPQAPGDTLYFDHLLIRRGF